MFKLDIRGLLWCLGLVLLTTQSMAQVKNANEEQAIAIQLLTNKAAIALEEESPSSEELLIGVQIATEAGWHFYWAGIGTELLSPLFHGIFPRVIQWKQRIIQRRVFLIIVALWAMAIMAAQFFSIVCFERIRQLKITH